MARLAWRVWDVADLAIVVFRQRGPCTEVLERAFSSSSLSVSLTRTRYNEASESFLATLRYRKEEEFCMHNASENWGREKGVKEAKLATKNVKFFHPLPLPRPRQQHSVRKLEFVFDCLLLRTLCQLVLGKREFALAGESWQSCNMRERNYTRGRKGGRDSIFAKVWLMRGRLWPLTRMEKGEKLSPRFSLSPLVSLSLSAFSSFLMGQNRRRMGLLLDP